MIIKFFRGVQTPGLCAHELLAMERNLVPRVVSSSRNLFC